MYPHERSLVQRLEGKPFVLLGVNSDPDRQQLKTVMQHEQITWRSWCDGSGGPIAAAWQVEGWPSMYVLDRNGVIRHKFLGSPGEGALNQAIDAVLAQK